MPNTNIPLQEEVKQKVRQTIVNKYGKYTEEALDSGIPSDEIAQQAGLQTQSQELGNALGNAGRVQQFQGGNQGGGQATGNDGVFDPAVLTQALLGLAQSGQMQQQQAALPKFLPAKGLFSSAEFTPEGDIRNSGFLANLFGTSTFTLLEQQKALASIEKDRATGANGSLTPLKLINSLQSLGEEQRRLKAEQRRGSEFKVNNIDTFGGNFTANDIDSVKNELGIDLNSLVEGYGLTATTDRTTGERVFKIPPKPVRDTMAASQKFTSEEETFLNDNIELISSIRETRAFMAEIGLTAEQFNEIGSFNYKEFTSNVGPLSLAANFNIAAKYGGDRNLIQLKGKLERMFQSYRKVITGAQASAKELNILRPLFPSATDRPGVIFDSLQTIEDETGRNIGNRIRIMDSFGRRTDNVKDLVNNKIKLDIPELNPEFGGGRITPAGQAPAKSNQRSTAVNIDVDNQVNAFLDSLEKPSEGQ
jgi:hypothetical protein